jgi:ribosomal protein L11 methyltransferase
MQELVLHVSETLVEAVSDALTDQLGALAVSVEDAQADSDAERAMFGEPGMPPPRAGWAQSTVRALFDTALQATHAATLLLAQDWTADGVQVRSLDAVPDEDWVRVTQSQFAPVEITPTFWIVPSWHEAPAAAQTVIRLDPGLAFGTGTHPTTRMCLRWIARHAEAMKGRPRLGPLPSGDEPSLADGSRGAVTWPRVLDYGCGSGILAIGAALHGASSIDAVDIDSAAVESTRANAQSNGVALNAALPHAALGTYDLVLANILAKPLTLLAPLLTGHLAAGASLVLAGILARQADELRAAYAPWCALDVADSDDGWVLMVGRSPAERAATPKPALSPNATKGPGG